MLIADTLLIKSTLSKSEIYDLLRENMVELTEIQGLYQGSQWYEVSLRNELNSGQAFNLAHQLQENADIFAVDPLMISDINVDVSSELSGSNFAESLRAILDSDYEWHLEHTKLREAWDLMGSKGGGVKIGHLDTGYTEHPENILSGRIRTDLGFNFVENTQSAEEPLNTIDKGHGAATSSLIISPEGRQPGYTGSDLDAYAIGFAPDSELVPVRVDKNVLWLFAKAADVKGIHHAVQKECDVISMSRGGFSYEALFEEVEKAFYEGIIVVAAAGNRVRRVVYPARYAYTVAVSGSTMLKKSWSGASRGKTVDISAPAHLIYRARTRNKNSDYVYDVGTSSGTSYAAPIVASAAALWISHHGGRQNLIAALGGARHSVPIVFKYLLKEVAFTEGVNWNAEKYGPGIIDIAKLIEAPLPSPQVVNELLENFSRITSNEVFPRFGESFAEFDSRLFENGNIDDKQRRLLLQEYHLYEEFYERSQANSQTKLQKQRSDKEIESNEDLEYQFSDQLDQFLRQEDLEVRDNPHDYEAAEEWQELFGNREDQPRLFRVRGWRVAKCLQVFKSQIDNLDPDRSRISDGTIGDEDHENRSSDHNPWVIDNGTGVVTAQDITHNLNKGVDCQTLADALTISRDKRIKYIIWNKKILRSYDKPAQNIQAWEWHDYNGNNPHTNHLHLSVNSDKPHYDSESLWDL